MPTPTEHREHDDLLSPSLTQSGRRALPPGEKPWHLGSQVYVAFFGARSPPGRSAI